MTAARPVGDRLGGRRAARIAALAALGTGQQRRDLLDERIALHFEIARGEAEHRPKGQAERARLASGGEHGA